MIDYRKEMYFYMEKAITLGQYEIALDLARQLDILNCNEYFVPYVETKIKEKDEFVRKLKK